jgi:hypothetical protein
MEDQLNQLFSVDDQKRDDLYLKDFVNKRAMLLNETLRQLSQYCVQNC